jgi:hypothetical protein
VRKGGLSEACFSVAALPVGWKRGLFVCWQNVMFSRQPVDARSSRRKLEAERHQRLKRARAFYEEKAFVRKQMLAERSVWPNKSSA